MLAQLLQLSLVLDLHHTLKHSRLSTPSHFSLHKQQNPKYPVTVITTLHNKNLHFRNIVNLLTVSPPDANDILGISCLAISSLVSNVTNDKNLLDTVSVAFDPALYISGASQMHCITCLSTRRFLAVFKPAASQTRVMHSL